MMRNAFAAWCSVLGLSTRIGSASQSTESRRNLRDFLPVLRGIGWVNNPPEQGGVQRLNRWWVFGWEPFVNSLPSQPVGFLAQLSRIAVTLLHLVLEPARFLPLSLTAKAVCRFDLGFGDAHSTFLAERDRSERGDTMRSPV